MPYGSIAGIIPFPFDCIRSLHAKSYSVFAKRSNLCCTVALAMGSEGPSRRPFCLKCSKPARTCICARFPLPPLDNSISVTILLHSSEKKHPLNSTRIAKLGLRNLEIVPVTDVNFHAQLFLRPLEHRMEALDTRDLERCLEFSVAQGVENDESNAKHCNGSSSATSSNLPNPSNRLGLLHTVKVRKLNPFSSRPGCKRLVFDHHTDWPEDAEDSITRSSGKCTVRCSNKDIKMLVERAAKPKIDWVLETPIGRSAILNGFVVSKLQRKELRPTNEFEDFEEFEILVPPGAALLFPSDKAISMKTVDFEVKHLVVLDGTWAKAKRIYYENPWLQLLPHLKLDLARESLYAEVRHEPKAGCFSTIESIVCAMKDLGSEADRLDQLLDVFRSMIGDQRTCKDENFRGISEENL